MTHVGTLLVAVLDAQHLPGQKRDLDAVCEHFKEKKGACSWEKETLYILEAHMATYVPFGCIAFTFGLSNMRPSLKTAEEVLKAEGGKRPRRRKKEDDIRYGSHVWIPLMSKLDTNHKKPASWVYAYLRSTQGVLKSSYMEDSGHGEWMAALGEIAAAQKADSAEKKKEVKHQADATSSSEGEAEEESAVVPAVKGSRAADAAGDAKVIELAGGKSTFI